MCCSIRIFNNEKSNKNATHSAHKFNSFNRNVFGKECEAMWTTEQLKEQKLYSKMKICISIGFKVKRSVYRFRVHPIIRIHFLFFFCIHFVYTIRRRTVSLFFFVFLLINLYIQFRAFNVRQNISQSQNAQYSISMNQK